jgi:hypothetical protein
MARKYRFGRVRQTAVRKYFRANIIDQYKITIKKQLKLPDAQLWFRAANLFGKSRSTVWRWAQKHGRRGKADPQPRERPLDDLFRYLAASNASVTIPRGGDILLLSLAATLEYLRGSLPGCRKARIFPTNVELIRSVARRVITEFERADCSNRQFVTQIIETLPGQLASYSELESRDAEHRQRQFQAIIEEWLDFWVLLTIGIPFGWIYGDDFYNAAKG